MIPTGVPPEFRSKSAPAAPFVATDRRMFAGR
jgi:hypothetical protein